MPVEGQDPQHEAAGILAAGDLALDAGGGIYLPGRALAAAAGIGRILRLCACAEAAARELATSAAGYSGPHKVRLLAARDGQVSCQAEPIASGDFPDVVRLELAAVPVDAADPFLYHKTTQREIYAAARAGCGEGDDVLLYNRQGEVTETTLGNIVVRCGENYWTPPVSCGLLAGTYRAKLLAEGKIRERVVTLADLAECDELFFINSVRLWRKARLVGPRNARSLAAEY